MQNRNIRSMAYAFIANDINVYLPDNQQECFIIEHLSCKKCNAHWHTSLSECYFCGETNYYIYECTVCGEKYSITNASQKCTCGSKNSKLIKTCINPKCPTNTDKIVKKIAIKEKGVFDLESSFHLSLMHCVECGYPENYYRSFKVFIFNDEIETDLKKFLNRIEKDLCLNDIIIFKKHNSILKYNFLKHTENINLIKKPSEYLYKDVETLIKNILK